MKFDWKDAKRVLHYAGFAVSLFGSILLLHFIPYQLPDLTSGWCFILQIDTIAHIDLSVFVMQIILVNLVGFGLMILGKMEAICEHLKEIKR